MVGAKVVAKSPPDGHTWMIVFDNHILNTLWGTNLPYKDSEFTPITQMDAAPKAWRPIRPGPTTPSPKW